MSQVLDPCVAPLYASGRLLNHEFNLAPTCMGISPLLHLVFCIQWPSAGVPEAS